MKSLFLIFLNYFFALSASAAEIVAGPPVDRSHEEWPRKISHTCTHGDVEVTQTFWQTDQEKGVDKYVILSLRNKELVKRVEIRHPEVTITYLKNALGWTKYDSRRDPIVDIEARHLVAIQLSQEEFEVCWRNRKLNKF